MGKAFAGQSMCVSGKFSRSQAEMKALVSDNGGAIADTPNKSCTFLVADSIGSAKTIKAQKDGIPIVTEEWLVKSIAAGKPSTDSALFLSGGGGGGGAKPAKASPKAASAKAKAKKAAPKRKKQSDADEEDADEDDDALSVGAGGPMGSDGESDEEARVKKQKTSTKKTTTKAAASAASSAASSKSKAKGGPVFAGLVFTCSGKFSLGKAGMDALLSNNGATVSGSLGQKVTHVVSNEWPGDSEKTLRGAALGLQCVDEAWVGRCVASGQLEQESWDNSKNRADDNEPELCDKCGKELVKSLKQGTTTLNMECPACGNKEKFAKQGKYARM